MINIQKSQNMLQDIISFVIPEHPGQITTDFNTTPMTNSATCNIKGKRFMISLPNTRWLNKSLAALFFVAGLGLLTSHTVLAAAKDNDQIQHSDVAKNNQRKAGTPLVDGDDLPPVITLISPANNSVSLYPASFNVEATITWPGKADGKNDKRKGIEIEFLADGKEFAETDDAPYRVTYTPAAAGIHILIAKIRFGEGRRTILSVPVTVISDVLPVVSITAPADNSVVLTPANVTLSATATSQIGTISKVDFYAATTTISGAVTNTLIGTATSAPFVYDWSNLPVGSYTLSAVATDNYGISATSGPINLTVKPGELEIYYIDTDQLGTPRVITDTSDNVVWQWDNSDPFGNNAPNENPNNAGTFNFNLRFAGQYFDRETNLNYNTNRNYDPSIGRYMESDPIGLRGGINTYTYVNGNPLSRIDPLGLFGYSGGTSVTTTAIGGWGVTGGTNGQFFSDGSASAYGVKGTGWGADVSADAQANVALYFGSGSGGASSWAGDFTAINVGAFGFVGSVFWGGGWFGISGGAGVAPEGVDFGATVTNTTYVPIPTMPTPNPSVPTNSCSK